MLERVLYILVIIWALGLFVFKANELIHILLILAAIVFAYILLTKKNKNKSRLLK